MRTPAEYVLRKRSVMSQPEPGPGLGRLYRGIDKKKEYGGRYDVLEGRLLILMRRVLEGKIKDNATIMQIEDAFDGEFPASAIDVLKSDIEADSEE